MSEHHVTSDVTESSGTGAGPKAEPIGPKKWSFHGLKKGKISLWLRCDAVDS